MPRTVRCRFVFVPALAFLAIGLSTGLLATASAQSPRPNILWITSEDNGPHLGCYGDKYAKTPAIDGLAADGMLYRYCWSNAPVCAPARTTIISGMYPPSTGSQHMRSMTRLPDGMKMFPCYLREAGYYCTNNSKEDYNLEKTGVVWDESSRKAHWKNRAPGQPFFAVVNHTISHESQLRKRPHTLVHDPAGVRIPAYHPDTPEVRHDWAQYYDKLTEMDQLVGETLAELEQAGLAEDTIVFYYGDHGSGMPRSKRWPYNSGLHVPLIVRIPEKFQSLRPADYTPGGATDRMVGFVDLAPTVLSLAGLMPPEQFHGEAFLGKYAGKPAEYLFGFRGRMDERYDFVRTVRDRRFVYVRNYNPHKIYGQYVSYMFQTPTTQVWARLATKGKLTPEQHRFWETKPAEELYDLQADRDEVHNLADSPEHRDTLERLRKVHHIWVFRIRDLGFLPENEIHSRAAGSTPYEVGHDPQKYPLERIWEIADVATRTEVANAVPVLLKGLEDQDSAVRYWAAMGLWIRGTDTVRANLAALEPHLNDPATAVQIVTAETLGEFGSPQQQAMAVKQRVNLADQRQHDVYTSILALNALDDLGEKSQPVRDQIATLPNKTDATPDRMSSYAVRLIDKIVADLRAPRR